MNIFIEPFFAKDYIQNPLVLVDIGSSGGFAANWKPASQYLSVIGFEPDPRAYADLLLNPKKNIKYLNTALYSESREIDFYLTRKQQVSSIFRPSRSFLDQFPEATRFDIINETKLKTDTLDNQFRSNNIPEADFIKIDTQGTELPILQGAQQTIRDHIIGVEVEVEYAPIYDGQPVFADVDKFLRGQGFHLFDLKNYYWKRSGEELLGNTRGQAICADVLYLRTLESFRDLIGSLKSQELKKIKILKALSIYALYGYFDYGSYIFKHMVSHFDKQEQEQIEGWFKSSRKLSSYIPHFYGKNRLSKIFYKISEFWRITHHHWATVERELGNR